MTLPDTRVVVLTRQGCHLCDAAIAIIQRVCRDRAVPGLAVDVDADPALRAQYTDHVPVTFVDGVQHAQWFLDAERFAAALG